MARYPDDAEPAPAGGGADQTIEFTQHDVPIVGLPAALDGCRLVQVTDIHRGKGDVDGLVEAAVTRINASTPDYILLTGDIVDGPRRDILPAVTLVARLRARRGIYACLGNHDERGDPALLASALDAAGIPVLDNRAVELAPGFWLAGIDDLHEGKPDLQAALATVPLDAPGILLSHNPGAVKLVDRRRPLIILSGHTHGGQWRLPLVPPVLITLWHLHTRFVAGWYSRGALRLYVCRGLGATGPGPLARRIRCAPEVADFRLVRASASV